MAKKKATEEITPEIVADVVETKEEPVVEEKPKTTRKKKAKVEEPVVEEIVAEPEKVEEPAPVVEPEPVVEEEPKPAKKAPAKKAPAKKVEEPKAEPEEVKVEAPAKIEVAEVKEVKNSEIISEFEPYKAKVSATIIHSRKGPGLGFHIIRDLYKGAIVVVYEVDGNWGRISKDTWININYIERV